MANILLARGGTPDFKGWFCAGQYPEFTPPYDAPHMPATPPFDSHADAAYGQGYLNLQFPLVPNLNDTTAHVWMQHALKKVKNVNDIILTNWVPLRSYLDSFYIEVSKTDPALDGVYVKPVAMRVAYNFTTEEWDYTPNAAFDAEITASGITQFPLGTPQPGDKLYGLCMLNQDRTQIPSTFGHNLVARNAQGDPTGGLDANYGAVLFGLQFVQGDPAKIATVWRSNIAVYLSAKLLAFEGASQIA